MKILILVFILSSCASHTRVVTNEKSEYGPVNHQDSGVVKYLNQGADFIIKKRRKSAFKDIHKICNSKWELVNEYQESTGGATHCPNLFNCYSYSSSYNYIKYKCVK